MAGIYFSKTFTFCEKWFHVKFERQKNAEFFTHCFRNFNTAQCGNWAIFPATFILCEINLGWFQKVKICRFNNFGGSEYWFWGKIHIWKCLKVPKIQLSKLQKYQNWFHVKSEWQKYPEISIMCTDFYANQILREIKANKS